jgi:hypothetical protein
MGLLSPITDALGMTASGLNDSGYGARATSAMDEARMLLQGIGAQSNPDAEKIAYGGVMAKRNLRARAAQMGWDARMLQVMEQHINDTIHSQIMQSETAARQNSANTLMQKAGLFQQQAQMAQAQNQANQGFMQSLAGMGLQAAMPGVFGGSGFKPPVGGFVTSPTTVNPYVAPGQSMRAG